METVLIQTDQYKILYHPSGGRDRSDLLIVHLRLNLDTHKALDEMLRTVEGAMYSFRLNRHTFKMELAEMFDYKEVCDNTTKALQSYMDLLKTQNPEK